MTTIAYDGITLATDSLITSGSLKFGYCEKIFKLKKGRYLACAGSLEILPLVVAWFNGGPEVDLVDTDKITGIVVNGDGSAMDISNELRVFPACIPWSGGTGEEIAMTAMRCGKNAAEAVAMACELDINSGGDVQSVKIRK